MPQVKKTYQLLFAFSFILMLCVPELNRLLEIIPEEENSENRKKSERPIFDLENLDEFTEAYDKYYSDNFSLRSNLIDLVHQFEFNCFGISPAPRVVVVGKGGWFYATKSIQNYSGINRFKPEHLTKIREELLTRSRWCEEKGIEYYVVVIPNKMTMYPEHLPSTIIKKNEITRYDQICDLDGVNGIEIIGLKEVFNKRKQKGDQLYYATDDHWNDIGAYYGYQSIMNRISLRHNNLSPFSIDYFDSKNEMRKGNMAKIVSVGNRYMESSIKLSKESSLASNGIEAGYETVDGIMQGEYEIVKVNRTGAEEKCLIIRDSFSLKLIKFFQEHFSKTVLIHDGWKYRMREDIILSEKPDIVVNIILETYVHELLNYPFKPIGESKHKSN